MAPLPEVTEMLNSTVARFPRARLKVVKGPSEGAMVVLEGQTVLVGSDDTCQLVLKDGSVSRRHLELSGGPGGYRLRDLRSTNGVFVEGLQVVEARLTHKVRIRVGRSELRFEPESKEVEWPLSASEYFGNVYGRSPAMRRVFAVLEKAAPTSAAVLLEGEAGTGKETLARNIHSQSARAEKPFHSIDLSVLSPQQMEEALFGEKALLDMEGGTLFLDEVSELPLLLQSRFLKWLETDGSVRIVSSTRKPMDVEVRNGRFREDLFFKLSVFHIRVPSLRERAEDIPQLATHLAQAFKGGRPLSEETIDMLSRHEWEGNVRELRNVVERLCAFPDLGQAALENVLGRVKNDASVDTRLLLPLLDLPYHEAKERVVESFERTYLAEQLRACGNIVTRAAIKAGLPRQSVHRMLRRLGMGGHSDET